MYDAYSDPLCRLCLANDGDMVYVFDPKGYNGYRVWEIIWELLQLEVSKEDGLPGTICHECLKKVTEFKNFKTVCIRAKISILTHIASRGIVDGDCTPLKPSVPSKPVPKIENAVVPLPPLVKKCDGGSSEDLELLQVIGECKANGNARKTSRLGKRKKKAMGSLRSLRFSSKLPSGGVTKSEPELVEITEEDIEDEVVLDGAKESSSKNKGGDSPVDSSGTSQAGKDDGPSLNKKSRTEEKHSTANKTVDDSETRKPTKEDHASRTSHLRSGKVKGRDKDGQSAKGPLTAIHAQKEDDHNVSKTSRKESTQSSVGKPAEESDKHKEGHAGRTSGLHREKTKGREKKDSHSSVDSSGTSQAGKDGGTNLNRKSRTEDSGSSAGKREDSGTRKASKDLDHTTKTSILPKEKGKGREKKGLQVSEESSRGSKSKEGGSPMTSAGHDKKQDRELKAVTKEVVQEKSVVEETAKKLPKGHEEGSKKRRCKETSVERPLKVSKKDVPSPVNNARESDASALGSSKGAYVGKGVDASAGKKVSDAAKASTSASVAETVDGSRSNRTDDGSASLTIPVNRGDSRSNASGAVVEEDPNVVLKNGGRSQKNKTSGKKSSLKKKATHVDREESEAERSNVPGTVNFIEVPVTRDVIDIDAEVNVDASADPLATIKTEPVEEQPLPTPSVNGQKLRPKGPIYDSVYSNLGPVKEEIVDDPKSSGPAVRGGLSLPPVAALGCPKVKEEPVAVEEIAMDFEEQKYSETLLMGGALPGCPSLPPAAESSLQSRDPLGTGGEGQELNFIAIPSQNPADGDQPFVEVNEDPFADSEENNTSRKEPASTPAPGAEVLLKGSGHVAAPTVPGNSLLPPQNAIVHPLPLGLIPSIVNSHVPVVLTENQSIAPGGNLCVENFQSDGISGILPLSAVPRDVRLPVQEGIQGFAAVASQNVSLASVPLVVNSVNSPSVRQVEFGGQCSDVGVGIGSGKTADLVSGQATARNPVDSSLGCEKLGINPDGLVQPAQISAPPRDGSSPGSDADTASVPGDLLEEMAEEEWQSAGESDDGWERTKASEVDLGGKIVKVVLERLDDAVVAYYMKGRKESHAESLEDTDDEVREGSMGTETMPFVLSSDEEAGPSRGTAPVTSVSEIQAGQCSGKAVEVSVNEPVASVSSKGLGIEKKTQRKQSKPMGSSGSNSDSDEWTPSNFWGSDWEGDSNSEEEFEPTLFSRKRPNILSKTRTKVPHSKAGHRGPKLEPRPFLGASLPGNAVLSSNNVIVSVGKQFVDVGTLITRLQRSVSGGYVVVNPGCGQSQTESQVPEKGGVESRGDGSTVQNDGGSSQNAALSINTLLAPVSEKDVKKVCFSKPRSAWLARVSNDLDQSPVDSLPQQSRAEGMVNNVHCCDLDQTTGDKSVKPSGNLLERAPVKKLSIVGDSGQDPAVIKSSPSVTAPQSTPLTEVASLITRGVTVDSSIEASKHAGVALKDASLHSEGRRVVMSDGCLNLVVAANDKLPSAPNENMCDDLIRSIFGRISDLAARRKSVIMDAGTSPSRATFNPELVTPAKQKVRENVPCTSVGVDLSSGTQFVDAGGCVTVKIISTDQNSEKEPSSFIKPWETVGPLPEGMAATSRPSQASNHRVLTQENVKSASSTITPGVSSDFLRVPSSVAPEGDGLTADTSRLNVHSWPVSQGKEVHPSLNCHKPVGSVKNLSHLGVLLDAAVVSNIMQSAINSDSGIALVSGAVPPVVKSTRTGAAKNIAVIRPILDQTKVARSVSDSRAPINDNKGIALDVAVQVPKEIVQSHGICGDSAIIPTAGREVPSSAPTPYNVGTNSDGNLESGPSRGATSQNAVSYPDNAMAEGCRPLMASTSVPGNSRLSLLKPSPSQALDTGPQLSTQGKSILKQHVLTNYFSHAGSSSKNPEGAEAVQREKVPCPQQAEEPLKSSSEPGQKARSGRCGTTTITGIMIPDSNPGEEKVLLKCIWCEEKPCELTELMCHLRGKHMDEVTKLTSGKSMQQVADAICSHPQLVPENVSSGLIGQGSVPNKATVLENAAGQVSGQGSVPNKATVLENAVGQVSGEGSVPNKATVLENAAGQVSGQGSVLNKATVLGNAAGLVSGQGSVPNKATVLENAVGQVSGEGSVPNKATVLENAAGQVSGQGSVLNKATVLGNAAGLVSGQGSVLNKSMVLGNAAGQVSRQESVLNKATVLGNAAGQVSWQRSVLSKATVPGNAAGQVSRQESVLNKGTVLGNAAGQVSGQRSVLNKATVLGNAAGQVSRQESVLNKATVLGNSVGQVSGQGSVPNKAMVLGNAAGQVSGQGSVLNKATVQGNAASQVTVPESVPNEARVPANVSSRPALVQSVWIENPKFGNSCKNMILKCIWCGQPTFTFNELSLHMNEHHQSQIASLAAGICVQPSSGGSAAVSSTMEPARVGLPPVVSAPKHTERYRCKFCDYTHLSAAKLNEHLTVNHSKRLSEMMKCKPSGGNPVQPWRVTAVNPKIPSSSRTVEYVDISDGEVETVREAIKEAVKLPPISIPGEYKCRYCPEVFTYRHLLKDHKKVFHSSRSGHKNKLRSGRERTYVDQAKQPKATPKVYHSPRGVFIDSVVKDERKSGPSSSSYSRYVDGGGSKESSTPSSSSHSRNVDGVIGLRDDNCAKPSEVPQSTPSSSSHSRNVGGGIGSRDDNCAKPSEVPQSNPCSSSHSRNVDGVIGSGEDNCAKPSEVPQGTPFTSSHSRNVDGVIGSGEDNCAKPSEVPQGTPFSSSHSRNVDGVIGSGEDNCAKPSEVPQGTPFSSSHSRNVDGVNGSGEDNCAKPSEVPQGTPFSSLHSRNVDGVIGSRDDNCAKPSEVPQSNPSSQSRNIGGSSDAKCTKPSQSEPSTPKSISQNTVVQCPKCPSTFPNVREISRHLEEFHNVLAVSNVQNMTAADRARKQGEGDSTAKKEQVGKDLVKCSMCPILFNTPEEYRSHFAKIHMPQVYERQKQIQRDRLCKGTGVTDNSHTFL